MFDDKNYQRFGFYLEPYQWIEGSPLHNGELDTQKITEWVFQGSFVDDNNNNVSIYVYRDGLFLFEFHYFKTPIGVLKSPPDAEKEVPRLYISRVINAYLAILYRTIDTHVPSDKRWSINTLSLTPHDIWETRNEHRDGQTSGQMSGGRDWHLFFQRSLLEYDLNTEDAKTQRLSFLKYRETWYPISLDIIGLAWDTFKNVLGHPKCDELIIMLELLSKSLQLRTNTDYDWALMTAWAGTERALQVWWKDFLDVNEHRIDKTGINLGFVDKNRKKRLTEDTRTYSASVVLEILSWAGEIDLRSYQILTEVRQRRNDWIHKLKHVSEKDTSNAIKSLLYMIQNAYKFRLP